MFGKLFSNKLAKILLITWKILGKFLVNAWPAWPILGMGSHSHDLGMNSFSFLLVSVSDLGKPFPNWYVSVKIVMSRALLLFLCQNYHVSCFKLVLLCQNCYVSCFIATSVFFSCLQSFLFYKEVHASWVHTS